MFEEGYLPYKEDNVRVTGVCSIIVSVGDDLSVPRGQPDSNKQRKIEMHDMYFIHSRWEK